MWWGRGERDWKGGGSRKWWQGARKLLKEEATMGIERKESIHVHGSDVGTIFEDSARKKDAWMRATETMMGIEHLHYVEEREREKQVGM